MTANAVSTKPVGIPEYQLTMLGLSLPGSTYCDECKNMLKTWPWKSITHQAVNAMEQIGCPLCKFLFDSLSLKKRIYSWEHNKLCTLDAWADEGDPHCDVTTVRSPITHLTTDSNFKAIRKWMQDCSTSHVNCKSTYGDFLANPAELPKRVVDVNAKDGYLRIHESLPSQKETYTALSYVWDANAKSGQESPKREVWTKREEDGETWFEERSLPLGFQDAVELTRRINVRYLWVDALCVNQNDPEDRKENVSQLLDIFQNAAICIRPANIDNIHQSFLRNEARPLASPICKIRVMDSKDREIVLKLTTKMNDASSGMARYDKRLRSRAWPVMEAFAAPRHVTITHHNEMTFFCLNPHYTTKWPHYQWVYTINDSYNQYHYVGTCGLSWATFYKTAKNAHRPWEPWTHLVNDIHEGAVTRLEDRLEMLSSIAKDPVWDGEYLFGLWKKHAREGLMWDTYMAGERGQILTHAPTWSWGSVGVRVCHPDLIFLQNWQFRVLEWTRGPAGKPVRTDPPILGTVILRGRVISCKRLKEMGRDILGERDYYRCWTGSPLVKDIPEHMVDEMYVMLLAQTDFGPAGNRYASPTKKKSANLRGTAQNGVRSSQSGYFAETGPTQDQSGGTGTEPEQEHHQDQEDPATPATGRSRRRQIADWFGSVPRSIGNQRPHMPSMRPRWSGFGSRHGRSQSQTQPETSAAAQKQYAERPQHKKTPSEPAVVVQPPDPSDAEDTGELTWRRSLEEKGAPYPPEFMAAPPPKVASGFDKDSTPITSESEPVSFDSKAKGTASQEPVRKQANVGEVRYQESEAWLDDIREERHNKPQPKLDPNATWQRLHPDKGTKLMVLHRVSDNTYERYTMITRYFKEDLVDLWEKKETEVIHLI